MWQMVNLTCYIRYGRSIELLRTFMLRKFVLFCGFFAIMNYVWLTVFTGMHWHEVDLPAESQPHMLVLHGTSELAWLRAGRMLAFRRSAGEDASLVVLDVLSLSWVTDQVQDEDTADFPADHPTCSYDTADFRVAVEQCMTQSADGRYAAVYRPFPQTGQTIQVVDVATGHHLASASLADIGPANSVHAAAFHPNGEALGVVTSTHMVIWEWEPPFQTDTMLITLMVIDVGMAGLVIMWLLLRWRRRNPVNPA
jgi:hypothetical protein